MDRLPPKERMKIKRSKMPEQDALQRAANFLEVNIGLPVLAAQQEAQRCLDCADPKCVDACPVGMKINDVVTLVLKGEFDAAAKKIREDNVLPAVTGRVCPQENQCEGACVLGKKMDAVAIGSIERFIADHERETGTVGLPDLAPSTGKKVAIIGSGPAGLSCAGDMAINGHDVTVFEALHEIGGVLIYGIPEFRLPKAIVKNEIDNMKAMGIKFETNVVIGKTITIDELLEEEGFDTVFIATGAGLPKFLQIPGEHLGGVYSANEFLTRVNLMKAYDPDSTDQPIYDCRGKNVAVVGGGNTAMDSVRCALRMGAKNAYIIYRRSEEEMPARKEEVHHAKDEGVQFLNLVNPVSFLGDDKGMLKVTHLQRMELGEPDESGRRRPSPVEGSDFELALDVAIIAVGTGANPLVQSTTPDLDTTSRGYIVADDDTLATSKPGVFAGGDIVSGSATVIRAMGAGRKAAKAMHQYLMPQVPA